MRPKVYLAASNGRTLATSEPYANRAAASRGIDTVRRAAPAQAVLDRSVRALKHMVPFTKACRLRHPRHAERDPDAAPRLAAFLHDGLVAECDFRGITHLCARCRCRRGYDRIDNARRVLDPRFPEPMPDPDIVGDFRVPDRVEPGTGTVASLAEPRELVGPFRGGTSVRCAIQAVGATFARRTIGQPHAGAPLRLQSPRDDVPPVFEAARIGRGERLRRPFEIDACVVRIPFAAVGPGRHEHGPRAIVPRVPHALGTVPVPRRPPRRGTGGGLVPDREGGTAPIQPGFHRDVAETVAVERRLHDR